MVGMHARTATQAAAALSMGFFSFAATGLHGSYFFFPLIGFHNIRVGLFLTNSVKFNDASPKYAVNLSAQQQNRLPPSKIYVHMFKSKVLSLGLV